MPHLYPKIANYYGCPLNSVISMKEQFKIERKAMRLIGENHADQKYLNNDRQNNYLVEFSEDKVFQNKDEEILNGEYLFVLTCEEHPRLLCDLKMHHSFMANGKKVFAAGSMLFEDGALIAITNNSGHYKPTNQEMLSTIKAFAKISQGTLKTFKSYCDKELKTYAVQELLQTDDFSVASPLKTGEIINSQTGKRTTNDYDELVEEKTDTKNTIENKRRFGNVLSNEINNKYYSIVKHSFLTSKDNNTPLNDPLNEHNVSQPLCV